MLNQYVLFCRNPNTSDEKHLKKIFPKYFNTWMIILSNGFGFAILSTSKQEIDFENLRDEITAAYNCDVLILKIFTDKNGCGNGIFSKKENWEWIKDFCKDYKKEIENDVKKNLSDPLINGLG